MKNLKTKRLELQKVKIAKLDHLDTIKGGSIVISIIKSYDPDDCANTTGCRSYGCPGTTIIRV